jgi:tetratricopeptide (TPR) repeat protein
MGISLLAALLQRPESDLISALGLGSSLRLLRKTPDVESYSIHQLIREVRREEIPLDQRNDWLVNSTARLASWFKKHKRNFADLPKFEAEIEHLNAWHENLGGLSPSLSSRLIWLQAYPPFHRGRYKDSLTFLLKSKEVLDNSGEADDELEGNLFTDLSTIYGFHGKYAEAKKCALEAVEIRLKLFGEKNVDTAMSLNNLGATLRFLDEAKEGLDYCERALKIWQELEGEKHIDTALALDNIGAAHMYLRHRELALEFTTKAFDVRREVLGLNHTDTISSLQSLGNAYLDAGKVKEAIECHERSLIIAEKLLGKRTVWRAFGLKNLGQALLRKGDQGAALKSFQEALEIRIELFGETHPEAVRLVVDCAFTLCNLKRNSAGHLLLDQMLPKIPKDHLLYKWFKDRRLELQQKSPRPGFRQAPHRR